MRNNQQLPLGATGLKALTKYESSTSKNGDTTAARCGLNFSVELVAANLQDKLAGSDNAELVLSLNVHIFVAAGVFEYLTAEMAELAGNKAADNNRTNIVKEDVLAAIAEDSELAALFPQ